MNRHLPIVCFDNRLEPIPISMKNIGYRPIPIPIPILYEALSLHTAKVIIPALREVATLLSNLRSAWTVCFDFSHLHLSYTGFGQVFVLI